MTITDLYKQLFGRNGMAEGNPIDMAEHGRVGSVSTGQGFKWIGVLDSSGNQVDSFGGSGSALATVTAIQGDAGAQPWLVTMATLPVVTTVNVAGQATVTSIQGDPGAKPWLATLATLPVVAAQTGTWTVQPGNTPNTTAWLVTMATLPVVTSVSVAGQATVTALQGDAGAQAWPVTLATLPVTAAQAGTWTVQPGNTPNTTAWLATMATLPVMANIVNSPTVTANAGTNLNTSLLALESGGNLATIASRLDVTLGSRLASGSTLPITGTVGALAAGGSLTVFQDTLAWRTTQATLPVVAGQIGTWTVQPGNTPNTTAWLVTMATTPVQSFAMGGSLTAFQGGDPWRVTLATLPVFASQAGTWTIQPGNTPNTTAWLVTMATLPVTATTVATLASGSNFIASGQYLPTLLSLASDQYRVNKFDLFGNLMVNTNVPLPNSTRINQSYTTTASMASLMGAPGAGKRLVIRELDFSCDATLSMKIVETPGSSAVTRWGQHYFLPYSGAIKPQCYIPLAANTGLGIHVPTPGNFSVDLRIETENV